MPHNAPSSLLPNWELAINQLRDLAPGRLDPLVSDWLRLLDLQSVRLTGRNARYCTYAGILGQFPFDLSVHCRVYQRKNRLQTHDVEAFLGSLLRQGIPVGLLVTTGDFSREAYRLAAETKSPRIQLVAGPEWTANLAQHKIGLARRSLRAWLLDTSQGSCFGSGQARRIWQ